MKALSRLLLLLGLLVTAVLGLSGCKSTESENLSSRPWNAPTTWQNGLPTGLNEGR